MASYAELAAALEPVGLPITMPGEEAKALPCITLEPTSISLIDGARVGFENVNVMVRYELGKGNAHQFAELNAAAYHVLQLLLGSRFPVAVDIPLIGNANTEPPSFAYQLEVTFQGLDICPPSPTTEED